MLTETCFKDCEMRQEENWDRTSFFSIIAMKQR